MRDYYLKFTDHDAALTALGAAGITVLADGNGMVKLTYQDTGLPAGMLIVKAVGGGCDGAIYTPSGDAITDADGFEYSPMIPIDGFHVNIRQGEAHVLPVSLTSYAIDPTPATPNELFS